MTVISSSSGGTIIIRAIRNLRSTVGAISPSNGWFGNLHLEPLRRLRHTNRRGDFVISRSGAGHKAFAECLRELEPGPEENATTAATRESGQHGHGAELPQKDHDAGILGMEETETKCA